MNWEVCEADVEDQIQADVGDTLCRELLLKRQINTTS